MRNLLLVVMLMLITACNTLNGPGRGPGSSAYIEKGVSVYDGKRYVKLVPGSLFDADNSPGVFKLGMVWDERYGDNLHLIVTFPLGTVTSTAELRKTSQTLSIKIDKQEMTLPRVKGSISIREDNAIVKKHQAHIKYKITRQTIKSMLSASQVVLRLRAASETYEGGLYVPAKAKNYYANVHYTAISGLKRFYKEVWGTKKDK